jgi:hypothetical protein
MKRMKQLLMAGATIAVVAIAAQPVKADIIVPLGVNPTSGAGAFANTNPGTGGGGSGLFADRYDFTLVGDQVLTIAFATNTFAGGAIQKIEGFTGAVVYEGLDGQIGGGDDQVVIGPTLASACIMVPNCQGFGGSAILDGGEYHLLITGNAGIDAGYGGNLSTFAVPGPEIGGLGSLIKLVAGLLIH